MYLCLFKEQRQTTKMIELQNQLDRLTHENMALEVKVAELSAYQNEVVALKSEISKLQVILHFEFKNI